MLQTVRHPLPSRRPRHALLLAALLLASQLAAASPSGHDCASPRSAGIRPDTVARLVDGDAAASAERLRRYALDRGLGLDAVVSPLAAPDSAASIGAPQEDTSFGPSGTVYVLELESEEPALGDVLALLDAGALFLDAGDQRTAYVLASDSALRAVEGLSFVRSARPYRADEKRTRVHDAAGSTRAYVFPFSGDRAGFRRSLDERSTRIARYDETLRCYVVNVDASAIPGLLDDWWVRRVVTIDEISEPAPLAVSLAPETRFAELEELASRQRDGSAVVRSWMRSGALFVEYEDGQYGMLLPSDRDPGETYGEAPAGAPAVRFFDESRLASVSRLAPLADDSADVTGDAWVANWDPDRNYGSEDDLRAFSREFFSGGDYEWSFVKTGGFTIDGSITHGYLKAYMFNCANTNPSATGQIAAYEVSGSWDEHTITWSSKPSSGSSVLDTVSFSGCNHPVGWEHWTITSTVQAWSSGTRPNRGVRLSIAGSNGYFSQFQYRSREASGQRPFFYFIYEPPCYTFGGPSVSPAGSGTSSKSTPSNCGSGGYSPGTAISLTASPAAGKQFNGWTGTGGTFANASSPSTTFTITGNASVTANFIPSAPSCYQLTTTTSPAGTGSVHVSTPQNCSGGYTSGTVVSLTAQPSQGWMFSSWSGATFANPSSAATTITMTASATARANFIQGGSSCYVLTTAVNPSGAGAVTVNTPQNCSGGYTPNTAISLTATPSAGWRLTGWASNGGSFSDAVSANQTFWITNSTATVTASFVQESSSCLALGTAVNPAGSGTVTVGTPMGCTGGYLPNTAVTLTAQPAAGWQFTGWTGSGGTFGSASSPTTTFTILATTTVTAGFTQGATSGPAITSFTASTPGPVPSGAKVRLQWGCTGGTSASIDNGVGTVPPAGGVDVYPTVTTTYTLVVSGAGGAALGKVTVTVEPSAMVLLAGRFRVEATYRLEDGRSGLCHFVALTDSSGYFYYDDPRDIQAVVKVLDVCGFNRRIWVFAGGLTDQEVHLKVIDTQTNVMKTYDNALKQVFVPIQDTGAFSSCP